MEEEARRVEKRSEEERREDEKRAEHSSQRGQEVRLAGMHGGGTAQGNICCAHHCSASGMAVPTPAKSSWLATPCRITRMPLMRRAPSPWSQVIRRTPIL